MIIIISRVDSNSVDKKWQIEKNTNIKITTHSQVKPGFSDKFNHHNDLIRSKKYELRQLKVN